jgi:hypothetical protein
VEGWRWAASLGSTAALQRPAAVADRHVGRGLRTFTAAAMCHARPQPLPPSSRQLKLFLFYFLNEEILRQQRIVPAIFHPTPGLFEI